ncbi:DUF3991 domain-containing protein [Niallia sp. MER 6]|uniref:DUF3991 domain-containing protein n=1 Tax=Niallia sp. MER 6 TaxID=2939567 RepID=UPI00203F5C2F|nr:DUF3991 domain-containing protein [Niallia sp. MER 6]MCM3033690.1 DUF3991 domain-containing protein [Niallia sp. MER 6]
MPAFTKEQIKHAEAIDIIDYCEQNGIDVKSDNERYYRLVEHDSCVIDRRKNAFYWNSRGKGGNVINFVQEIEQTNFMGAMNSLLNKEYEYQNNKNVKFISEPYEYSAENEVDTFDKARDYLVKERKIDSAIVEYLYNQGIIKQDKKNNVLFLWKDYENVMGCSEQGTVHYDKFKRGSWKSIQKNSTANYGFNFLNGEPKNLKMFESSVDALSYATLNKGKIQDTWLISMEGLKYNTVLNYVIKAKERLGDAPDNVSLCVDNDAGGKAFIEKLSMIQIKRKDGSMYDFDHELPNNKSGKDWNEQLKFEVKHREQERQKQQHFFNQQRT